MNIDHATYAETYADDAQRAAEVAADELISLASKIKLYAQGFKSTLSADSRSTPSSLASKIISQFMSQIGNIGSSRLEMVVYNAGQADVHRAQIKRSEA